MMAVKAIFRLLFGAPVGQPERRIASGKYELPQGRLKMADWASTLDVIAPFYA